MGGPDGLDRSWSIGSIDVTGNTDNLESRGLDDGDRFDDLLLVDRRAGFFGFTNDVRHTGLETDKCGQVDGLGCVILRK